MKPDFVRAYLMARLSSAAYLTEYNALSLACAQLGLEYVRTVTGPGFQAVITRWPGRANVIALRGTPVTCGRSLEDTIRALAIDVGLQHMDAPQGGKVLAGVWRSIFRHWEAIAAELDHSLPIIFTGHSLGAALALCASDMLSEIFDIEVWAFAPFQFADQAFLDRVYASPRRSRWVFGADLDFAPGWNHLDPVTTLAGPIWHLLRDGTVETVTSWPAYRESVTDHSDLNYVALVGHQVRQQMAEAA